MTHSPSPGRDANIDKDFELYMSHEHVWVTQLIWSWFCGGGIIDSPFNIPNHYNQILFLSFTKGSSNPVYQ